VTPHLGEDHAHGQGDVPGLGKHPTQRQGVLPAPVGGEADEVPHRALPVSASRECPLLYVK
jgi:hypothetical protein